MPRGGQRAGRVGAQYSNRSDLQNEARTAGQPQYGEAKQRAAVTAAPDGPPAPPTYAGPQPGSLTPLTAPTERPDEPITAGLPIGAGPGPEALVSQGGPDGTPELDLLRQLYLQYPEFDSIRRMIQRLETEG